MRIQTQKYIFAPKRTLFHFRYHIASNRFYASRFLNYMYAIDTSSLSVPRIRISISFLYNSALNKDTHMISPAEWVVACSQIRFRLFRRAHVPFQIISFFAPSLYFYFGCHLYSVPSFSFDYFKI